jgi:serine/threonine protein kinase
MKREPAPDLDRIRCVLETVRALHDAGLRHRDLNLANLLVRESGGGWEVHVIDLDRGALAEGPLPYRARLASLRRLERSYEKHVGRNGPLGADPGLLWYSLYAGEDGPLAGRLEASRRVGRILLALHRLTW